MDRGLIFSLLGLTVLVLGALAVCPDGQCFLLEFDRLGLSLAHGLRCEALDWLFPRITWLGSLWLLLPAAFLDAWFLDRRGRRREAGFILSALLSCSVLSHAVKLWVARPRPDLFPGLLAMPTDWSYPSAHAMQATATALALLLVAGRWRPAWVVPLVVAVLLVGLSRVYLQVHYPSDVVTGTLAAALWVKGLHILIVRR